MFKVTILSTVPSFAKEFERCCREYKSLHIATAWCGNPNLVLPYSHLETFEGEIRATIGISFNHTHPNAIDFICNLKADLRIFRDEKVLFHPKLYFFSQKQHIAIFIGSSNLTYSGFYNNIETNVLLEGMPDVAEEIQVAELRRQLEQWHSDDYSFIPSPKWIASYRKIFEKVVKAETEYRIKTPSSYEEEIASASWLRNADWKTYYKKVIEGLKQHERSVEGYHEVLNAARHELPLPWKTAYFDDPEKRKIIGGIGKYGWLGHVTASGQVLRLLAAGTAKEKQIIVDVINEIVLLNPPIDWDHLSKLFKKLIRLGPTIKVWGRFLCLVRPDLYCTVASISVRKNLSKTLELPQIHFESLDGYIQLLKLVHASPWFNSSKPTSKEETDVWQRRAAFMDAIFY